MNLGTMLTRCKEGQWSISDIDWSRTPRPLGRSESEVVQYFTDMAAIERLAGALFAEQERHAKNPQLASIFRTFVIDEERHAVAAERLARHFDRNHLKTYEPSPSLIRFRPRFLAALQHVSAELANAYIVGGELLLDIALLRSIDDYVDDPTCHDVMEFINRDESRHVAVDYFMIDYYASDAWALERNKLPPRSMVGHLRAAVAFSRMLLTAKPFIRDVFIEPMTRVDPKRRRMREAFKRMQLLGAKPGVAARPFSRFIKTLQIVYQKPLTHRLFGPVAERLVGIPGEYLRDLYSAEEWERARSMSMDDLALDALSAKHAPTAE